MCGRFTLDLSAEQLIRRFGLPELAFEHAARYNIAPSQSVLAVIQAPGGRRAGMLRWGLVPHWAKESSVAFSTINAKVESVDTKPAFRDPFARKRCLVPSTGYYEWQKTPDGKQPYLIRLKDAEPFAIAGLYDVWVGKDGERLATVTLITTPANVLTSAIHDRMPAILTPEAEAAWLDPARTSAASLKPLLGPYPPEGMETYPVSSRVGNVRIDEPSLITRAH